MAGPSGYSISNYGRMVTSEPRMSAYAEALRRAVTPGCTVIDIGAGPGVFSLLACQFGAGSVIAIEPDDTVMLLHDLAVANGFSDRITIVHGLSTEFTPSAKADVIISDVRGSLPLFEGHIATVVDARERLLAPHGKLIPSRDCLRVALVETPMDYAACEEPWVRNRLGLDLSLGGRFATNSSCRVKVGADALISQPVDLFRLDYYRIADPDARGTASMEVARAGTAHGLLIWFDAELAPGIGFSNAPGEPPQVYGHTLFPFERPVDVAAGDRFAVEVSATLVDGSYVWGWNSSLRRQGQSQPELEFRQSSFLSKVISPLSLQRRASGYVPPPHEAHAADRLCLSLIDGQRTLAEIASELQSQFPARFTNAKQALNHVAELTNRYR